MFTIQYFFPMGKMSRNNHNTSMNIIIELPVFVQAIGLFYNHTCAGHIVCYRSADQ